MQNKVYKAIAYAYPTSPRAYKLSEDGNGVYYVEKRLTNIEGSGQEHVFIDDNCEGFASPTDPDLIAIFMETDGDICPRFKKYGNAQVLEALKKKEK
jgi:hypothetical protein